MAPPRLTPELRKIIREVILGELGRYGADDIRVEEGVDHDGDPAIIVDVLYGAVESQPDPRAASATLTKLNDRLYESGEHRFAYMSHLTQPLTPLSRARVRR